MGDSFDASSRQIKTKLFIASVVQPKDELEEKLEKCQHFVSSLSSTSNASEREMHDGLMQAVNRGPKEYEDVCLGMLYQILTESVTASKTYRDLSFITKDGMQTVVGKLTQMITDKYMKLLDSPKIQLMWLLGEMIKSSIQNLEAAVSALLRNIIGGDISPGNMWLAENMFKLLKANKAWLVKNIPILQLFVFKFLRVIEDHDGTRFKQLRQAEIEFVVQLIREKFMECAAIGRDYVRLLHNVFRLGEFQKLWKDIIHNPHTLSPQFTGLLQILTVRTPRKFLTCLITPEMETKIGYLVLKVKFGSQRRYQEWFFRQYLSNPENQTLIPDLIRFICGVIHPPNEVLGSNVIPRWAVIGWLYTACHNNMSQANTKLALFYDWLFYKEKKDNIMNIEPAILLMYNSLKSHTSMTFSLLDFICRICKNYLPQQSAVITQGVLNSWKAIVSLKVINSLSPILKNGRMDKELRALVAEMFPSLVIPTERQSSLCEDSSSLSSPPLSPTASMSPSFLASPSESPAKLKAEVVSSDTDTDEAVFSDGDEEEKTPPPPPPPPIATPVEEEKLPPPTFTSKVRTAHVPKDATTEKPTLTSKLMDALDDKDELDEDDKIVEDVAELEEFQQLDSNLLKDNLVKLKTEKDESSRCEAMEAIITNVRSMGDLDEEAAVPLCTCLANALHDDLLLPCLPSKVTEKSLEHALQKPQYNIFRAMCTASSETSSRDVSRDLYTLMMGLHDIDQKFGYHFLFYLSATYNDIDKLSIYDDYVSYFKDRTLRTVLTDDLRACSEYDPKLFMFLIEKLLRRFKDVVVGNKDVIHMLTATIHPGEMNGLIERIVLGEVSVIGENQVGTLLTSSLTWSSFEQSCLWRLISAEDTPVEMIVGVLPKLTTKKEHAEALNNLLLLLRTQSPSLDIIKPVLCMEVPDKEGKDTPVATEVALSLEATESVGRSFSLCLFKSWCMDEPREMAQLFTQTINKAAQNKKQRITGTSSRSNPTLDQIIVHINELYKHCIATKEMGLFKYEMLRSALTQAKKNVSDEIRTRCKLLFSEFSELPERTSRKPPRKQQRVTRGMRGPNARKRAHSSDEDEEEEEEGDEEDDEEVNDSEDGSDEEETSPVKTPTKKRRKPSRTLSSDEED